MFTLNVLCTEGLVNEVQLKDLSVVDDQLMESFLHELIINMSHGDLAKNESSRYGYVCLFCFFFLTFNPTSEVNIHLGGLFAATLPLSINLTQTIN